MTDTTQHPLYGTAPREWGRWGPDDEIGRANLLDQQRTLAAAHCIRTGRRFSLALPLFHPGGDPGLEGRVSPRHTMTVDESHYRDGSVQPSAGGARFSDDEMTMACHGTTHMDALGHAYTDGQLWNGYPAESNIGGLSRAGVEALAVEGVVGRAVLVDIARHEGVEHLPMGYEITVPALTAALEAQETTVMPGDVLLIRTGILTVFYDQGPEAYYTEFDEPGLTYSPELLAFVQEHDIAGLGSDTLCNEQKYCGGIDAEFPLHIFLLRNLGISFHEALWLEEWAADCAADRRFEAFYVAAPLRLVGATGAPMNPIVIK
jgi:kynurenine formamidase